MSHRLREDDQGGNLFWSDDDHYFTSHIFFIYSLCKREMQSALQEITVCLVRTRVIMVGL